MERSCGGRKIGKPDTDGIILMIAHLYKITNNLTNEYYIGNRKGSEQGRYWGSGLRIKRHIKKYGKENFTYDILRLDNENKIFKLEERLITNNYIKNNKLCLNLAPGGQGGFGNMPKDYMKGDKNPSKRPEVRARLSELMNENHPLVIMSKTNNPNKGKKQPKELKQRISITLKQRYKDGLVCAMKGKKHSLETRKKMSENHYDVTGKNNPFYGKKHPKEVMEKIKYKISKDYGFLSPENKVFKGRNLVEFCKQMKLSYDSMYLVLRGKQAVHKGWRTA